MRSVGTTHLLDTNICSYLLRKKPPSVVERLAALGPRHVAISVITAVELRTGADLAPHPAKYHAIMDVLFKELPILPLDSRSVRTVATVRAALRRAGSRLASSTRSSPVMRSRSVWCW